MTLDTLYSILACIGGMGLPILLICLVFHASNTGDNHGRN